MSAKPMTASALSMIGGGIVLFFSLLIYPFNYIIGGEAFGIPGIVSGVMMMLGGSMVYLRPEQHRGWGFLVLIFSILSIMGYFGGFFVGLTLGIIGGVLSIRWRPTPNQHYNIRQ